MSDVVGSLKRAAPLLLPSLVNLEWRRANGVILLQFRDVNDFILASIGASSANIKCELFNYFHGKSTVPRSIESCQLLLDLETSANGEHFVHFMREIANLKLADGLLSQIDYDLLVSDLKSMIRHLCQESPQV